MMSSSNSKSVKPAMVKILVWAVLIANAGITVTGALVRLTGSGLGCPTWPLCTDDSLVATPEMGIHGAIEFGNRLLTFVLLAVTIAAFWIIWRSFKKRRDLFWMSILLTLGIPLQAVVGGISVLFALNPYIVGLHFVLSVIMVSLATVLLLRVKDETSIVRFRDVSPLLRLVGLGVIAVVLIGILTTGSGPHAGDSAAERNGLNPELMQHLHSWPAYATLGLVLIVLSRSNRRSWWFGLLALFGLQITVGIWQSRTGLPIALVATHVLLAMATVSVATAAIYRNTISGSIATTMKRTVK
jgi:cytochrome c oxidase assembly protein subunit 15